MSRVADEETLGKALQDPAFKQTLRQLLATDNVTNLGYLVRTWLYLASVLAVSITFLEMRADLGIHWSFTFPVVLIAVFMVGAGQHQLTGLAHEGSHFILMKNRTLN